VPIDPDTYDYDAAVFFNYGCGRLWNNTKTRLRDAWDSLAFFAVREWQDRGALHLHVLVRIDAHEAPAPLDLEVRARQTTARLEGQRLAWGVQSDCVALPTDGDGAKAIWYVSKVINYAHKDIGTKYGATVPVERRRHLEHLATAALRLRCDRVWVDEHGEIHECDGSNCAASLHRNWGARGHVVTYSRATANRDGWSLTGLTRRAQRQKRIEWAIANRPKPRSASEIAAVRWARQHLGRAQDQSAPRTSRAP
jgi:hypothetical protein